MHQAVQNVQNSPPNLASEATHSTHASALHQTFPLAGSQGNQAILRRLSRTTPRLQCKLTIGAVNDPLEAEADNIADQVMRMPDLDLAVSSGPHQISRKCAACEEEDQKLHAKPDPDLSVSSGPHQVSRKCAACEEEDKELHAKPDGALAQGEAPSVVHDVLNSSGQPLDPATRSYFEPRFGRDLSGVKIHIGPSAAESARAVNAHAYTVGSDIAFAAGRFSPSTTEGRRLLAHELTHVMQQGAPPMRGSLPTSQNATPSIGTAQRSIQRDANSPDYQRGYQDGLSGGESTPGPLNDDAMTDYDEGYLRGHYEFTQQHASGAPPAAAAQAPPATDNTATPAVAPAATPDAGPAAPAADANAPAAEAPAAPTSTIDSIVAAVNRPQENGVGDYQDACGILNGMWIVVMMQTLEQLRARGVFDLLQTNCPSSFTRVQVAIAAVAAKGSPPAVASFVTDHPGFNSLPDQQQHEVATYLGLPWPITQQPAAASSGLTTGQTIGYVLAGAAVVGTIVFFIAFPEALPILALIVQVGSADVAATVTAEVGTTVVVEMVAGAATGEVATATVVGEAAMLTTETAVAATETATVASTTAATTTAATTTASTSTAALATAGVAAATTTISSDSPRRDQEPERNNCLRDHPFFIPCEDEISMDEMVQEWIMRQGYGYESLGECQGMSSFGPNTITACSGAPGQSFHCDVEPYFDPIARVRKPGGVVSVFSCSCCRADGTVGEEFRPDHWSGGK